MPIKGPGGPKGPSETDAPSPTDAPSGPGSTDFAERLGRTAAPTSPTAAAPADPVSAVAAELRAGSITPRQAVDKLVDLVVDKGAAAHLPEKVRAKIRADLETLLAQDPLLAGKLGRLGIPGAGGEPE